MNEPHGTDKSPGRRGSEPFLNRVAVRNYKSIGKCSISLQPLTILVGRNGSGKSNFLDVLRFVADGLQSSLDHAMKSRGGIDAVRRRSTGHPRNFAVKLEMTLPDERTATYGFEIASRGQTPTQNRRQGGFVVKREDLRVCQAKGNVIADYQVKEATVTSSSIMNMPPVTADRLYLVNAAGLPKFRDVYDTLISMGFYNLNPEAMKELQSPDAGELLHRDGGNIASVIARLGSDEPKIKERIKSYLLTIVPGIAEVDRVALGPRETLEFRQRVVGSKHPWKFYAVSMSDGTLRALGALVAVTQLAQLKNPASLVGIEEPETALHPAAAGALMDALREAAARTQVVITSHSPDLLDQFDPDTEGLLVVQATEGDTRIAPVDGPGLEAIKKHLYSPGEMLRMDQLEPDPEALERQRQFRLFESEDEEDS